MTNAAALAAAALTLTLVGSSTPALATATDRTATGRTGTATASGLEHLRVGRVVDYHLDERLPSGEQLDSGSASITYTCPTPGPGVRAVALADVGFARGMTFGETLTCDGRRRQQQLVLGRGTGSPFTPPAGRTRAQLRVSVVWTCEQQCPADLPEPTSLAAPVTVRFSGF